MKKTKYLVVYLFKSKLVKRTGACPACLTGRLMRYRRVKQKQPMKKLTRAEEQIMKILWDLEKGFVKDIIEKIPDPKPAYNTVSTIVRILEKKGFVLHKAYGKTHEYYPVILKDEYSKAHMKNFVNSYFSNSFEKMVSFFAREKSISLHEMEDIMKIMEKEIKIQKKS